MPTYQNRPLTTIADLAGMAYAAVGWLATGCLPRALLPSLAVVLARLTVVVQPGLAGAGLARMRCRLRAEPGLEELFREHLRRRHEHLLGRLLDGHRRRWRPVLRLEGGELLQAALAEGTGAVLWCMSFCGSLVAKMALAEAGFPLTHLASVHHGGFSRSWVATKVLNRWTTAVEDRYLAERVLIPESASLDYMRLLKERLRSNGCVSILGEHRGRRNVTTLCLGQEERLATGAPNLARSTGAALFTVSAHRPGPLDYRVVLEPLPLPSSRSRAVVEDACHDFAARLERAVLLHPADWERWSTGTLVP